MVYTKLNLENGHVLDEDDMAHIEDGIYTNDGAIEAIEDEIGSEESSGTILNKISRNTAEINQLKGIGKFLSNWNCATGKPYSDPSTLPYTYNTGDYYIITNIAETGPDYRPSGTIYTGAASLALEEQDVKIGDFYIFDATEWLLMVNVPRTVTGGAGITVSNNEVSVNYSTGLEVTNGVLNVDTDTIQTKLTIDDALSSSSTNPVQNKVINSALNNKQDTLNTDQKRKITISTSSPTGGSNGDIWLKYTV